MKKAIVRFSNKTFTRYADWRLFDAKGKMVAGGNRGDQLAKKSADVDEGIAKMLVDLSDWRCDIELTLEDGKITARLADVDDTCRKCGSRLNSFSGNEGMPAGSYCPNCNDALFNEDGKVCDLQ